MNTPVESYAAIDLGSNSFHMIVTNVQDGSFHVIDKLKETVRLAAGLDDNDYLAEHAIQRAMECLVKFGQRIKDIPAKNIRAVGTNTLRQATNSRDFLKKARKALGHPIEIISGREEARLIFLGVSHSNHNEIENRLVIDIGGGSTEVAIGRGNHTKLVESLYMGCVNMTRRFFNNGDISEKKIRKATLYAQQELESIVNAYKRAGWDTVYGSSGTIKSIYDITTQDTGKKFITPTGLHRLRVRMIEAGHIGKCDFPGLSTNRLPVFAGGVAILSAVFDSLKIEQCFISDGALREGLIVDLVGRQQNKDVREVTVTELCNRYSNDTVHAERVAETAARILVQVSKPWSLPDSDQKLLRWACLLHEIGLSIAHSQHHKHAAYLLQHSELAGFSRQEQSLLALLVRFHRRKIIIAEIESLSEDHYQRMIYLLFILRLAIVLNRGRSETTLPEINIRADDNKVSIQFPEKWLAEHPLTEADLETESSYISVINLQLQYQ